MTRNILKNGANYIISIMAKLTHFSFPYFSSLFRILNSAFCIPNLNSEIRSKTAREITVTQSIILVEIEIYVENRLKQYKKSKSNNFIRTTIKYVTMMVSVACKDVLNHLRTVNTQPAYLP